MSDRRPNLGIGSGVGLGLTRRKGWEMPTGYEYFTIEAARGGYQGKFYGANDELVWLTEIYVRKAGAQNAIALIKSEGPSAPTKDRA